MTNRTVPTTITTTTMLSNINYLAVLFSICFGHKKIHNPNTMSRYNPFFDDIWFSLHCNCNVLLLYNYQSSETQHTQHLMTILCLLHSTWQNLVSPFSIVLTIHTTLPPTHPHQKKKKYMKQGLSLPQCFFFCWKLFVSYQVILSKLSLKAYSSFNSILSPFQFVRNTEFQATGNFFLNGKNKGGWNGFVVAGFELQIWPAVRGSQIRYFWRLLDLRKGHCDGEGHSSVGQSEALVTPTNCGFGLNTSQHIKSYGRY